MQNPYNPQQAYGAPPPVPGFSGQVSQRTAHIMGRTKGWVRFLAVLFFISGALQMVQVVIGFMSGIPVMIGGAIFSFVGAILTAFIPGIKLNSYASRIGDLLRTGQSIDLERALNEHRSYWKYSGILLIIGLALFMVFFIFGIMMGISSASRMPN